MDFDAGVFLKLSGIVGSNQYLLLVASLAQQRELHRRGRFHRNLWFLGHLLVRRIDIALLAASDGQRNVKDRLSVRFPRVQAFSHHFGQFSIEIGLKFGIALIFRSGDDDILLFLLFVVFFFIREVVIVLELLIRVILYLVSGTQAGAELGDADSVLVFR